MAPPSWNRHLDVIDRSRERPTGFDRILFNAAAARWKKSCCSSELNFPLAPFAAARSM